MILDNDEEAGQYSSIVVDSNDMVHIAYYADTQDELRYAYGIGESWHIETVDASSDDVGSYCDIALDSNDMPHISYHESKNRDLQYAWFG